MNEIKIYLKTSGRIAELYKDFDLYEGCYRNSQMSVYVPKSLLYENENGTFANLVKTGAILTAPNGTKLTTKSYYLDYVKTETVVGIVYAVYTITTPKEFCVYSGTQTVVVNVESIDNTDKDNQKIISVTTTQTVNLIVLESAYLGQDEPIEPTELDKIKATLTEIEGDITGLQSDVTEIKEDITGLQSKVSDLSEDKLDKVSGNTTYKQAYAKDTNGDQIMQNYSTENVTNAIVQRDETGNIKITPGREGYMNDGATMRNIADVESEVAKKYDKTGGTIDGNVTVTGDLTVQGTTITENAETLDVKANVITTNSEGVPLINLSGLGIRTDATNVYGIMYDPQNDSVKLGLGSLDEDNNFTFNQGEGLPIAVRDDSTAFTDKHVIVWDAAGDKFVDGGKAVSDLPTLAGNNTYTGQNTFTEETMFPGDYSIGVGGISFPTSLGRELSLWDANGHIFLGNSEAERITFYVKNFECYIADINEPTIIIIAVLVAFLAVCIGFIFGSNTYSARAEETSSEAPQDSTDLPASDETSEDEETPDEDIGFDLDAFLEWVQKYADEAGIGDEYAAAVEAIKTAASEKQVTINTIASVAQLAVFIVYLIYTNVKNGRLKKQLAEVSEKLDKQIKGTNGLIDESNANGQTGQSTKKDVEAIKKATACYTKAFMQFMERFNIGAESKETIKHELNKAIQETEGEPVKEKADDEEDKAQ